MLKHFHDTLGLGKADYADWWWVERYVISIYQAGKPFVPYFKAIVAGFEGYGKVV